ncbi:non-ribosomal peptide synthetase [Pleionea sp. CnH1-48]|uniref:non-ribosomal peptide synthetase n=1 Tax=Pleionea sp. CnH1-48 TaxID=2954494 RepID=UPI002097FAE7|nr:non-ribosomal peptide synthetase [Pleionea sp. CnH1-48]MCO7224319.1 amino acid adenylation domain-containing protein [Pleionea sp. CnH1-48]
MTNDIKTMNMTALKTFLEQLLAQNVAVYVDNGKLKTRGEKGALSAQQVEFIKQNKEQLIDFLQQEHFGVEQQANHIPALNASQAPLTSAQQRLWFLDKMEGSSVEYHLPYCMRVKGRFDLEAAEKALNQIVQRHHALRSCFIEQNGNVCQSLQDSVNLALKISDLSSLSDEQQSLALPQQIQTIVDAPFDLSSDLMLKAHFIRYSDNEGVMMFILHHIAADAWSINLLVEEFATLYKAECEQTPATLPSLDVQYMDYANWLHTDKQQQRLNRQLEYWQQQLAQCPEVHHLPLDKARSKDSDKTAGSFEITLPESVLAELKSIAKRTDTTLFMILHSLFSLLLARQSQQQDIVIGTPVAGRTQEQLESMIGFFVNTLALRLNCDLNMSIAEFLAQVRDVNLNAQKHQDVPFDRVVESLQPERSQLYSPVIQIMLALHTLDSDNLQLQDIEFTTIEPNTSTAQLDLTLDARESEGRLALHFEYDATLFDARSIENLAQRLVCLAVSLTTAEDLSVAIGKLSWLPDSEHDFLLSTLDQCESSWATERCIHQLIEQQVQHTPERVAVIDGDTAITYQQLNQRANALGLALQEAGVLPEQRIALWMDRSIHAVMAILAVFKAGAAYVPLDKSLPFSRNEYLVKDSDAVIVLSDDKQVPDFGIPIMDVNDKRVPTNNAPELSTSVSPNQLAYIVYTSGTTGQPKGVMVEHQGMIARWEGWQKAFGIVDDSLCILQMAGIGVDIFLGDIVKSLSVGGKLVICPKDILLSATHTLALIKEQQINFGDFVPAVLRNLLDEADKDSEALDSLRWLLIGSEAWHGRDLKRLQQALHPDARCYNIYGQTESIIDVCYYDATEQKLAADKIVPIGIPLQHTHVLLLDEWGQPVPVGVIGEITIAGPGLARGYCQKPDLTLSKFSTIELNGHAQRVYRTGDQGRLLADGQLEFVGRQDEQIKIRGFRIELAEVEAGLRHLESIRGAVVNLHETASGEKQLVAYIESSESISPDSLRHELASSLPHYMIPAAFIAVETFPLTVAGKVDRRALPKPTTQDFQSEYVAPESATEHKLARLWAKLLKIESEQIGRHSHFFAMGGHSLLCVRLLADVRDTFDVDLPLKTVFEHPTLAAFANLIDSAELASEHNQLVASASERPQHIPLSYSQQQLWVIDQMEQGSPQYNMPMALSLNGSFDVSLAEKIFQQIIERHEILRTVYYQEGELGYQKVVDDVEFILKTVDLTTMDPTQQQQAVNRWMQQDIEQPFDLSRDVMLRVMYIALAADQGVLLFNMHHIASDGWSMAVLIQEFKNLYQAALVGDELPLPALEVQYADYSIAQRAKRNLEAEEKSLAFWLQQLQGAPTLHALPLDHSRPLQREYQGAKHSVTLDKNITQQLQQLAQRLDVTLFSLLHASFSILLARIGESQDIVIGVPTANRVDKALQPLIGYFVNTLALRTRVNGNQSARDFIQQVMAVNLDAQSHQQTPVQQVIETLKVPRNPAHNPLFQILFSMDTNEDVDLDLDGIELNTLESDTVFAQFDITLDAFLVSDDALQLAWTYDKALFENKTIEYWSLLWQNLLQSLVSNPDAAINELALFNTTQTEALLSAPSSISSRTQSWHEAVVQGKEHAESVAVVCQQQSITYAQLHQRSDIIAQALISKGVQPGDVIGLSVPAGIDFMINLLAIAKAGAAFLPLDKALPQDRIDYMVQDSQARYVLTQQEEQANEQWLVIDKLTATEKAELPQTQATDLAYVLYTSGSTGKPKGVMVSHGGLSSHLTAITECFNTSASDNIMQMTSISFDTFLEQTLASLWSGACLHLVPTTPDVYEFFEYLGTHNITVTDLSPGYISATLTSEWQQHWQSLALRCVVVGGEAMPTELVKNWFNYGPADACALYNAYGPTEAIITSSLQRIEPSDQDRVRIGQAVGHRQLLVLNEQEQLCPQGSVGELYISGDCLALGYIHQPELTAQTFVQVSIADNPPVRCYRTGDRVRRLADGSLEFIGRKDEQISIRGFRIEPGEVESRLSDLDAVHACLVMVHRDENDQPQLTAYIIFGDQQKVTTEWQTELRAQLANYLPSYMIPAHFIALGEWPLTINGKIDKSALPRPQAINIQQQIVTAETPTETLLVNLCSELLGISSGSISVAVNLIEMGLHSLLAVQLVTRLRDELNIELEIVKVLASQNLRELAAVIDSEQVRQNLTQTLDASTEEEIEEVEL